MDIRRDVWHAHDDVGTLNVLATHTTGTVTGHVETNGTDWLQSDVQTPVGEHIGAGLAMASFGKHTPEAEYRLGGYDMLRRTRLVFDSSSGIGPRLGLRLPRFTLSARSLWRLHKAKWIGAEAAARLEHRCRCLGLDISLNQHRNMRYPNAFFSLRLARSREPNARISIDRWKRLEVKIPSQISGGRVEAFIQSRFGPRPR